MRHLRVYVAILIENPGMGDFTSVFVPVDIKDATLCVDGVPYGVFVRVFSRLFEAHARTMLQGAFRFPYEQDLPRFEVCFCSSFILTVPN